MKKITRFLSGICLIASFSILADDFPATTTAQPASGLQGQALQFEFEANNGSAQAQTSLGMMFLYGDNIGQDYVQAYKWLSLAAQAGNKMASVNLKKAESKMTPEQIKTAQALVTEWKTRGD